MSNIFGTAFTETIGRSAIGFYTKDVSIVDINTVADYLDIEIHIQQVFADYHVMNFNDPEMKELFPLWFKIYSGEGLI